MAMPPFVLYEFPHSHYCEVARWTLEYKSIDYVSRPLVPGFHAIQMRRLAGATSVPVLQTEGETIQGSQAIVDFLETRFPGPSLKASGDDETVTRFEAQVSELIGEPVRRLCYYYLLPHPKLVRFCFMHRSGLFDRLRFRLVYPLLAPRLTRAYDCTRNGAGRAQETISRALDEYDRLLEDREWFFDDRFTRADLTFAALGAFMAMPAKYPVEWPQAFESLPVTEWFRGLSSRRSYQHIIRSYDKHRPGATGANGQQF